MKRKPIQESFGESIILAIHGFAESEMDDVKTNEKKYLSHVDDAKFRQTLAETLFGARWIYKLGLALLVKDEKQMAHVRAQLIDYCSVCEGVLSAMVAHGVSKNHFQGNCYQFHDFKKLTGQLNWTPANFKKTLETRSFAWLLAVAYEEKIITHLLFQGLDWMRKERNSVHLRARSYSAYIGKSHSAFQHMSELFKQTRTWKKSHQ